MSLKIPGGAKGTGPSKVTTKELKPSRATAPEKSSVIFRFGGGDSIGSIHDPRMFMVKAPPYGSDRMIELCEGVIDRHLDLGLPKPDTKNAMEAFKIASRAHEGETREATGEHYIHHPLSVGEAMLDSGWDDIEISIPAAIVHDTVENTAKEPPDKKITIEKILKKLGPEIAGLLEGLTKIRKWGRSREYRDGINLHNLLVASKEDIRVLIIKIFDREDNSETFDKLMKKEPERAKRLIEETLEFFVPIAYGLGLRDKGNKIKENCYAALYEKEFQKVKKYVEKETSMVEGYGNNIEAINGAVNKTEDALRQKGINIKEVKYSPLSLAEVFDYCIEYFIKRDGKIDFDFLSRILHEFTILIDEKEDCFLTLGAVHSNFSHILHTFEDEGRKGLCEMIPIPNFIPSKIKIRTPKMDAFSRRGVLSFYRPDNPKWYKEIDYPWLEGLVKYFSTRKKKDVGSMRKIAQRYASSIMVYNRDGKEKSITPGLAVLDYAFNKIHTEVGIHAVGAMILRGGKIIFLSKKELGMPLQEYDLINIITDPNQYSTFDDLYRVVTNEARSEISVALKAQSKDIVIIEKGKEAFKQEIEKNKLYLNPEDLKMEWEKMIRGKKKKLRVFNGYFKHANTESRGYPVKGLDDLTYLIGIGVFTAEASVEKLIEFIKKRINNAKGKRKKLGNRWIYKLTIRAKEEPGVLANIFSPIGEDLKLNIRGHAQSDPFVMEGIEGEFVDLKIEVEIYDTFQKRQIENIIERAKGIKIISTDEEFVEVSAGLDTIPPPNSQKRNP